MNPETLRQLIISCRRKDRVVGVPSEWSPQRVKHPEMEGWFFSDVGAWEFIADKLEAAHPYEELYLDNPPGALAIVMKVRLTVPDPLLYIKVQIGASNRAIGRSFHYSNYY